MNPDTTEPRTLSAAAKARIRSIYGRRRDRVAMIARLESLPAPAKEVPRLTRAERRLLRSREARVRFGTPIFPVDAAPYVGRWNHAPDADVPAKTLRRRERLRAAAGRK